MDFVIRQQKLSGSFLWGPQSADFILDHQLDEHLKHFSKADTENTTWNIVGQTVILLEIFVKKYSIFLGLIAL